MSFEGYPIEAEIFEDIGELQELGLGVDTCAVERWGEPCMANFGGAVMEIKINQSS